MSELKKTCPRIEARRLPDPGRPYALFVDGQLLPAQAETRIVSFAGGLTHVVVEFLLAEDAGNASGVHVKASD